VACIVCWYALPRLIGGNVKEVIVSGVDPTTGVFGVTVIALLVDAV
jgi:hypothetical protein